MTGALDEAVEVGAPATRPSSLRIFWNRLLFRSMVLGMGLIAVGLFKVSRDKRVGWRFAKARARTLLRLCGVRAHVHGVERLGAGPYMFTPNHQSHLDIALLLGYLPGDTRFGTKKELFSQPILGTVLRTMGMIPIDRENPGEAIERLNRAAGEPISTVVFPEGTRSRDGRLLPFKKGAFVAAIQLGLPIVPVVCKGTTELMPRDKYLSILPGDVELVVLEPIATSGMTYEDRDRLRDRVREQIDTELRRATGASERAELAETRTLADSA